MSKTILLLLFSALLFSCSPKIGTKIISKQNALSENDYVLVIDESDFFINDGINIGTIKSIDKGFSANCTYDEIIENFKKICKQNGANILNVIEHKSPDQWSSCHRVEAIIYKVPDYKVHEKQIEWSKDRKLTWNDFKGKPINRLDFTAGAESNCGFGFQSNVVRLIGKVKMKVVNTFDCNLSWVLPENKKSIELLEHEQLHFDLSQIYARHLRKKLDDSKLNLFNFTKESNKIFDDIFLLFKERQTLYDSETNHGINNAVQKNWKKNIEKELNELETYSKI